MLNIVRILGILFSPKTILQESWDTFIFIFLNKLIDTFTVLMIFLNILEILYGMIKLKPNLDTIFTCSSD